MRSAQNSLFSLPLSSVSSWQLCQVLIKRLTRVRELRMARTPDPDLILSDATIPELLVALHVRLSDNHGRDKEREGDSLSPENREFLREIESVAAGAVEETSMSVLAQIRTTINRRLQGK